MTISDSRRISMEYTLPLENEEVRNINVGGQPLTGIQGSHQIISGVETALEGMKTGECKEVTVALEQGIWTGKPLSHTRSHD
ncbi:MAG: FKBP-type peptidyl-prolyl cis-trans isomerase [Nitrospirales bacterium]